jgi:transcriptional regulatory protein RtcR
MATLAPSGRIDVKTVANEVAVLKRLWNGVRGGPGSAEKFPRVAQFMERRVIGELDMFDACQLESVLEACAASKNLSEAGRALFSSTRKSKATTNDADRLRKYLMKFGLTFEMAARG